MLMRATSSLDEMDDEIVARDFPAVSVGPQIEVSTVPINMNPPPLSELLDGAESFGVERAMEFVERASAHQVVTDQANNKPMPAEENARRSQGLTPVVYGGLFGSMTATGGMPTLTYRRNPFLPY